jgi:hypothetical protein
MCRKEAKQVTITEGNWCGEGFKVSGRQAKGAKGRRTPQGHSTRRSIRSHGRGRPEEGDKKKKEIDNGRQRRTLEKDVLKSEGVKDMKKARKGKARRCGSNTGEQTVDINSRVHSTPRLKSQIQPASWISRRNRVVRIRGRLRGHPSQEPRA